MSAVRRRIVLFVCGVHTLVPGWEVNTIKNLLHSGYVLLQRRTYDLNGSKYEGHMVYLISSNIKFMFPQCMEAVVIIAIQNDDQEYEYDEQE